MLLLRAKIVWNSSTTAIAAVATQIAPFLRLFLLTTLNGNGKYSLVVSIAQRSQKTKLRGPSCNVASLHENANKMIKM